MIFEHVLTWCKFLKNFTTDENFQFQFLVHRHQHLFLNLRNLTLRLNEICWSDSEELLIVWTFFGIHYIQISSSELHRSDSEEIPSVWTSCCTRCIQIFWDRVGKVFLNLVSSNPIFFFLSYEIHFSTYSSHHDLD